MSYWNKLKEQGITIEKTGKQTCPQCSHSRNNKSEKCLSVSFKSDGVVWNCHNCSWAGGVKYNYESQKQYYRPQPVKGKDVKEPLYAYWSKRGISRETLDKFKIDIIDNNIMVFPYYKNNELVNIKYRQNLGDGKKKIWNAKDKDSSNDTEKVLFGMDLVTQKNSVVICEGEPDCLSFWESGIEAVSVPNGAKEKELSWINNCWDWLQQFDEYIIAADNDKDGKIMVNNLLDSLDKYKCKILSYCQYKDANEVLVKEGKEKLAECVSQSKPIESHNIINFFDQWDLVYNFYENGFIPGLSTGWAELDNIFTIKPGYLMIITGYPSRGKSYFTNNLLLNLSELHGWKHLIASFESDTDIYYGEMAAKYKKKLYLKEGTKNIAGEYNEGFTTEEQADTINFISEHFFLLNPNKIWTIEEIMKEAEYASKRLKINCLVIDPYSCLKKDFAKIKETDYIGNMLSELKALARRLNILIIFVAHPMKMDSDKPPILYSISGSGHWYNFADYGIVVHREKEEETGKYLNLSDIIVQKVKNEHIGNPSCGMVQMKIKNRRLEIVHQNKYSRLKGD